jgi:hypothetical protein
MRKRVIKMHKPRRAELRSPPGVVDFSSQPHRRTMELGVAK